jgi:hypothetical protein
VTSTSANPTNDIGSKVALFWAVILSMTYTTAILTNLVFIVSESTVESCQLAKLISFMIVLPFRG